MTMKKDNDKKKALILVVEDEPLVAADITRTLNSLNYAVLPPVDSGEKALYVLEKETPDLILMDVKLKGEIDGIEAADIIREKYQVPFIYLSTFSDDLTLSRAKLTEPYGYITKNSHKNDLYSMIEMALYRHKMEKIVQEKEEAFSVTLKSISDAVIGSTIDGNISSWNKGAENIFGYTEKEVLAKNLSILTPPFYPNEMPEILDKVKEGDDIDHYETVRQKKDGSVIHVSVKVSPMRDRYGQISGVSIIARDMSARKRLEKELAEISEKERRTIGQDLHDSLGQLLTGISLQLKALENKLKKNNMEQESIETASIAKMVKDAIYQTKGLAKNLLTVTLRDQGLSVALQELAVYAEQLYGTRTIYLTDNECIIDDEMVLTQLYYIAQEAITNANRHAYATVINMSLQADDSEIVLTVNDNGNGKCEKGSDGLGLKIMEYRSNMIDGHLSIYSEKNVGTTVSCRVPLQKNELRLQKNTEKEFMV